MARIGRLAPRSRGTRVRQMAGATRGELTAHEGLPWNDAHPAPESNVDMAGFELEDVGAPQTDGAAARRIDVDTVDDALAAHEADVANPHGVTATQAGALPLAGGTLTGELIHDKEGAMARWRNPVSGHYLRLAWTGNRERFYVAPFHAGDAEPNWDKELSYDFQNRYWHFDQSPRIGASADPVATLDANGKIFTDQLPALAITEVHSVADIAARDALQVQEGDVARVADDGTGDPAAYIWDGAAWLEIAVPQVVDDVAADLAAHEADQGNPHNVTAAQAGAAPAGHGHAVGDISGIAHGNTQVVLDANGQADIATGLTTVSRFVGNAEESGTPRHIYPVSRSGGTQTIEVSSGSNGQTVNVEWIAFGS